MGLEEQMVKEKMEHILKEKIVREKHGIRANGKRTNDMCANGSSTFAKKNK